MEELKKFYNLLYRFRFIVIAVPLITIIIAYFLVRNLADQYVSEGQIATGIVDETQILTNAADKQESSVVREFSNLIEIMKLEKIINLVSYQLIIHDLTAEKPFRDLSPKIKDLAEVDRRKILNSFRKKYANRETLNAFNPDDKQLVEILESMDYNSDFISENLTAERLENSDFISVRFVSENPDLSAFVVNTECGEFVSYYTAILKENQTKAVKFLSQRAKEKSDTLNKSVAALKQYKIKNRIINLVEQSRKMYELSAEYETRKQEAEKSIVALKGAIANIDRQFDPNQRRYFEASLEKVNQNLVQSKKELNAITEKYIQSGFDDEYMPKMDSLKEVINKQILVQSSKYIDNPMVQKQNLIAKKLNLQVEYDIARYSLATLKRELADMNSRFDKLVPHEAVIQSLERKIDIASREYLDVLEKYNSASLEASLSSRLRQVQVANPGIEQPSKKMLLIILSGIISFVFCLLIFFIIFYFDNKIGTPRELAQITEIPVLGKINRVNSASLALKEIWSNLNSNPEMQELKKQLRSARYEISREMLHKPNERKGQVLNITSMNDSEGKTLLVACIAYSYVVISKKVLLIDGNFDHPSITENSNSSFYIEDYLKSGNLGSSEFSAGIMVMGNRGEDKSLFEIADEETVKQRMDQLRNEFDIILVETPSLETLGKAKEWNLVADKVMGVFEANQALSQNKKQHINYLKALNGQFIGWVINKVSVDLGAKSSSSTNLLQ
ncbi:lipopolysaccharide biosynthesis protein [Pelobium manganitolerans]|uniref:Lipopolysaccharide biosynthesis protein n=1 Tax=Pelobium manganitolerans TaxID=1842495 RepID=A0A419S3U1_9SPHI|nr:lipopolysaccharide biosynthesis protein [Pelobium manganitolerans]RKD14306.1 lipopolysaccharide biosynthesis protein [Pelobium manganitolerans]